MIPEPRGALVFMVGAPGCGKSTLVSRRVPTGFRFSLDAFRLHLAGDVADQTATGAAVEMLNTLVEYRMATGRFTVIDATNGRPEHRSRFGHLARWDNRPTVAVLFHTPLEVCLARQKIRAAPYDGANNAAVPEQVVTRIWTDISHRPPTPSDVDVVVHVHPTDPDRLIAETMHPAPWARAVLAEHDFMPDTPVIGAGEQLPWLARV